VLIRPNPLVSEVLGCAIAVHQELGPGLLESAYVRCLQLQFQSAGLPFAAEVPVPIVFQDTAIPCAYRADFVIQDTLLVELKSVSRLERVHHAQVLTYLRLLRLTESLLINFNVPLLKQGVRRFPSVDPRPST